VIVLDVRDCSGIVQVVYDPDIEDSFATADKVRNEFVLRITGRVRLRPSGTVNPDMKTGEIEVLGRELEILNASLTPPFQLDDYSDAGEDTVCAIAISIAPPECSIACGCARRFFGGAALPWLATRDRNADPHTCHAEGARLSVPSRTIRAVLALPQSPQVFKQLLMMSAWTKIIRSRVVFATKTCARTGSPNSPDRYRSVVHRRARHHVVDRRYGAQSVRRRTARGAAGVSGAVVRRGARRYASDKPDLRNPAERSTSPTR
jgi:aspartyl-tRNA synthetase